MASESDFDKKLKRLSRKTNLEIYKHDMSFERQLEKLDKQIKDVAKSNIEEFDIEKESLSNYLNIGTKNEFVERCRKKLDSL